MRTEFAYLGDILDACESIQDRVEGLTYEAFKSSGMIHDSVYYRLIVIGEALRNISDATLATMPEIPWKQIRRMRNVLTHDYAGVDSLIAWDVIENHLPPLIAAIRRVRPPGD